MTIFKNLKYLMLMLSLTVLSQVKSHDIVYVISNPRASLVELLRWAGNLHDSKVMNIPLNHFKVMHIPANYAYCNVPEHDYTKTVEGWYRQDSPTTYKQAKDDILKEAEKAPVFVGENTHTVNEFLPANPDFIQDPRVKFLVLIREPHGSTIDYYMQKKDYFDTLPEEQMSRSLGFEGLYNLLLEFEKSGKGLPLIVSSENLANKTNETIQKICDYLNIPFNKEALHWKDISENFTTFEDKLGWYTLELTECSKKWHEKAIKSTGFSPIEKYAVDIEGNPTFEEIENLKHREICRKAYEENLVFYDKIQKMIKV